ncbi:MAG TPA: methyltransferase domain-containing protein [Acidimicrobiia bacterium]|nr:methyltransferase domain-containing protein [Acidimicrobiia bacterium]
MSHPLRRWKSAAHEVLGLLPPSVPFTPGGRQRRRVRKIHSDGELDEHLDHAAKLAGESTDLLRQYLASFALAPPRMPNHDPFSEEYRRAQWDLYRRIARRDAYAVDHEFSDVDVEAARISPYPYNSGSPDQVSAQLGAYSFLVRALQLKPGARVVELGAGWGNLTLQFAMLGIDTTAVDVNPRFTQLLTERAAGNPHLHVVVADMLEFEPQGRYDAAIFFESFHHASDHLVMLDRLRSIVDANGVVAFAAEPIGPMPYPWGLRLDGLSLWSMRQYGWLELGFTRRYFTQALRRTGWHSERIASAAMGPLADVVLARRA